MKAKNLFFGALTCLAFAACSNDDEPTVNGGAIGEGSYVAVNIVTAGGSTRAATGDGFEAGTGDETKVDKTVLVFFKGQKFLTAVDGTQTYNDESTDTDEPRLEKISTVVAYLSPDKTGNDLPDGVIAILNGDEYGLSAAAINNANPSYTLTSLQTKVANYTQLKDQGKEPNIAANGTTQFVMSNSVWAENNGVTKIDASHLYKTAAAAEAGTKVEIFVERVLAKVVVSQKEGGITINTTNVPFVNDENVTIVRPNILRYHLAATTDGSNLVKQLPTGTSWQFEGWSSDAMKRSYWAATPSTTYDYNKFSEGTNSATTDISFYPQENTSTTNTKLVALAQLQYKDDNEEWKDMDSFLRLGNLYYKEDGFKNMIATVLSSIYKVTTGTLDWTSMIEFKRKDALTGMSEEKPWKAVVQLKSDADLSNIVKIEDDTPADKTTINELLATETYTAWMYGSGRCYYWIDIEHDGTEATGTDKGIVRNHVYQLELQSVSGLGTPVYDPEDDSSNDDDPENPDPTPEPEDEEEIIPETPTDEKTYFAAKINVLEWKLVSQEVELGK